VMSVIHYGPVEDLTTGTFTGTPVQSPNFRRATVSNIIPPQILVQ
jgi:hypothetical protein